MLFHHTAKKVRILFGYRAQVQVVRWDAMIKNFLDGGSDVFGRPGRRRRRYAGAVGTGGDESPTSTTLPYGGGATADVPTSRLATAAILAALLLSPCLTEPIANRVAVWFPELVSQANPAPAARWAQFGGPALAVALSIAAIVRVAMSRGKRRGMAWAVAALLISVLWLGFSLAVRLLFIMDGRG